MYKATIFKNIKFLDTILYFFVLEMDKVSALAFTVLRFFANASKE